MPKSGSTFLSNVIGDLPGFRKVVLVPDHDRREQELSRRQLVRANRYNYVAQHHVRHSSWTERMCQRYSLTPVVLVRSLFDVVVSLRDHIRNESHRFPMMYLEKHHLELRDPQLEAMIATFAIPWYLNFYMGWRGVASAKIIMYEDLVAAPLDAVGAVLEFAGVKADRAQIGQSIDRVTDSGRYRLNVGTPGRGSGLQTDTFDAIWRMVELYPEAKSDRYIDLMRSQVAERHAFGSELPGVIPAKPRSPALANHSRHRAEMEVPSLRPHESMARAIPPAGPQERTATASGPQATDLRWRTRLRIEATAIVTAVMDRNVRWYLRAIPPLLFACYLLLPIDPIPNRIPILGHLDDVLAIFFAGAVFVHLLPAAIREQHRLTAAQRFVTGFRVTPGEVERAN